MNYCSIQEAWGNYPDKNTIKKSLENNLDNNFNYQNNIETFVNTNNTIDKIYKIEKINSATCQSFLNHIKTCANCRIFIIKYCGSHLLVSLEKIIHTNKDIVVLILIGICILIFLNMINSLSKS